MIITKSIYVNNIMMSLLLNKKYTPDQFSTINELFDITNTQVIDTEVPVLNLLTIGKRPIVEDGNIDVLDYYISPTNAVLKEHIPMAARPITQGLSDSDKGRYRLRVERVIDNINYEFYYGLLIPNHSGNNDGTVVLQPTNDGFVPSTFNPNDFNAINPPNVVEPKDDNIRYVVSSNTFDVDLSSDILEDIYNANKLLHPDEEVYIGELGLCTSIDGNRSVNTVIGPLVYNESIYAQVAYTVKLTIPLVKDNTQDVFKSVTDNIDIGGMENVIVPSTIREVSEWRPE